MHNHPPKTVAVNTVSIHRDIILARETPGHITVTIQDAENSQYGK